MRQPQRILETLGEQREYNAPRTVSSSDPRLIDKLLQILDQQQQTINLLTKNTVKTETERERESIRRDSLTYSTQPLVKTGRYFTQPGIPLEPGGPAPLIASILQEGGEDRLINRTGRGETEQWDPSEQPQQAAHTGSMSRVTRDQPERRRPFGATQDFIA